MMHDSSLKAEIRSRKKTRQDYIDILVKRPSNSEAAQIIIQMNATIDLLCSYLGYEDRYSEEFCMR